MQSLDFLKRLGALEILEFSTSSVFMKPTSVRIVCFANGHLGKGYLRYASKATEMSGVSNLVMWVDEDWGNSSFDAKLERIFAQFPQLRRRSPREVYVRDVPFLVSYKEIIDTKKALYGRKVTDVVELKSGLRVLVSEGARDGR